MMGFIKSLFGSNDSTTEISYQPKRDRGDNLPKFRMRKQINGNGQVYIPVDMREQNCGSDVDEGDPLSIDVFTGDNEKERYIDVDVTSGYRITIPASVREELDIREDDIIAVHGYFRMEDDE